MPLADRPQVELVLEHPEGRVLERFIGRSDDNCSSKFKRWGAERAAAAGEISVTIKVRAGEGCLGWGGDVAAHGVRAWGYGWGLIKGCVLYMAWCNKQDVMWRRMS